MVKLSKHTVEKIIAKEKVKISRRKDDKKYVWKGR